MNPMIQLKKISLLLITLALACIALLPRAQAVVPAPDGGYPGGSTAEGQAALFSLTTGGYNTAVGFFSLRSDTIGSFNTAIGAGALLADTGVGGGDQNTATGAGALLSNTTGSQNTANGAFALFNTTGSSNIALGASAGFNVTTASNVICIGAPGANVNNSCYIGQIFGGTIPGGGATVIVDNSGHLGTVVSSQRFKDQMKPMDKASEAIFALKPVTFRYKQQIDPKGITQFGLVAEDVEKVNPDLVVHDKEGKPYSVRYDGVNAMLLNEFLKEHRKFAEEEATITQLKSTVARQEAALAQQRQDFDATTAQQQKGMEAIVARLNEQAAQIQKASDQLNVSQTASQIVLNNQ